MLPHPSPCCPQPALRSVQVLGTQPTHWLGVPTHVCGLLQVPHESVPPHPSPMTPQVAPALWQVTGMHPLPPQTLAVPPPPHVAGAVQPPQSYNVLPQPSETGPHLPLHAVDLGIAVQFGGGKGLSGLMQLPRSKSMYSRIFSCAVRGPAVHSLGKLEPVPSVFT